ncbi:hypothetical protein F5890DRAFT_1634831, partial [Lentinula detonsa]
MNNMLSAFAGIKRGSSTQENDGYVPNTNSQEGWTGPPSTSRVRVVASSSTDMLDRERTQSQSLLQDMRRRLGPLSEGLSIAQILKALLDEREALCEELSQRVGEAGKSNLHDVLKSLLDERESLHGQFAEQSAAAQAQSEASRAHVTQLKADLDHAREDSWLTREDAEKAKQAAAKALADAAKAMADASKAKADAAKAQDQARQAQTDSIALEAQLAQQLRREKEARSRAATNNPELLGTAPPANSPSTPGNPQPQPIHSQPPNSSQSSSPSNAVQQPPTLPQIPPGINSQPSVTTMPSQTPAVPSIVFRYFDFIIFLPSRSLPPRSFYTS